MLEDKTILAFVVLANIAIAFLVYVRNRQSATNRLFAALSIVVTAWLVVNDLSTYAYTNPAATWLVRLVMMLSVPFGVLFFLLVHTFPHVALRMEKKHFWTILGIMFLTMGIAMTPLLFPVVTPVLDQPPKPTPGIGMVLYVPVVIFGIFYGIWLLVRKFFTATGIERVQLGYLLTGVTCMFSAIIGFLFIAVNVFDTTMFISLAPLFTLPFTALTAYTIIRYRLMDIRLALFRALSLFFLVGAVLGIYGLELVFAVPRISQLLNLDVGIVAGAAALLSIPIAKLIQKTLTNLTDRFLFQNKIDYQKALLTLGQELSGTIRIEDVTSTVLYAMTDVLRAKKAAIFLRNPENESFEVHAEKGMTNLNATINPDNPIIAHLKHSKGVLLKDELRLERENSNNKNHIKEIQVIEDMMNWLDASVIVPLYVNKELSGMIILGEKLSGEPYLRSGIDFLTAFATQAAVALDNARLYEESLKFSEKLKKEVKRATKELEDANLQLKNLDKAKSEFLSIASHQLRTPLTALRGYVSMLKEGDFGKVPKEQVEILDILDKSATRLIELINSLLDISRIESGRLELNLEAVDPTEMAEELVRDLLPNAVTKSLALEFHPPKKSISRVVVDKQRVRQVMLNFIDNAIKYTEKGRVDVYVGQEGDEVSFWVKDTGKGITKEELALLFNKFSRVGGAARFHTEGTGLGLYVARQIVQEHRGEVTADSPGEGKGSTFAMTLPAEGSPRSLKPGEHAEVIIKAADAQGQK